MSGATRARSRRGRVEDALRSTRAVVREAFCRAEAFACCAPLKPRSKRSPRNDDQRRRSTSRTRRSSGLDLDRRRIEHKDYAYGYDAQAGESVNLYKLGAIDPTKVVRTARASGAQTPVSPRPRCSRASVTASRRFVLMRSPDRFGIRLERRPCP